MFIKIILKYYAKNNIKCVKILIICTQIKNLFLNKVYHEKEENFKY